MSVGLMPQEPMDAILVIDMLNDFVKKDGKLPLERAGRIIPNIAKLLDEARQAKVPIVYAGDAHLKSDPEIPLWGEHAMKGTPGSQIIDDLKPAPGDYVFEKRTYSAFHDTGVDLLLRDLGVNRILITGMATNICDLHTAGDAFKRGYGIEIVEDCVDAFSEKDHEDGMKFMKTMYNAGSVKSSELIDEWKSK
jgi:nicotinamidase-related amidase